MVNTDDEGHDNTTKQLQCGICCHTYEVGVREPVVLPRCGHTFCRLCLYRLQDLSQSFQCPVCRKAHTGPSVSELPVNYIVVHFLESMADGDECKGKKCGEGSCPAHGDPLLLWCCQCRSVLCAACLSQQHHVAHTLLDLRAVRAEKKQRISEETNRILQGLEKERHELTRAVESVASQLAKIYEKSEVLGLRTHRAENIKRIAANTDNLQTIEKLESLLQDITKSNDLPTDSFHSLLAGRGRFGSKRERLKSGPADDGIETTVDKGCEGAPLQVWPLTRDVAGGGRHWPVLSWLHFLAQVPAVQLLVPPAVPEVFLQLEADGTDLGRVHIRLYGQLRRAQHFLALCMGTFGPSYKGAKFREVGRKGKPGESLRGGDYPTTDGSGTSCRGVMAGLEWGGQHAGPVKKGLVGGGGGGCYESDALFNICLQDKPQGKMSCPFGEVVSGLGTVWRAAVHQPLSEVTITAAGLVLPHS